MDVADWLRNLAMDRYTAAFSADGITPEILRHLTDGDLADIGVAEIAHRRVLLEAIAAMHAPASEAHAPDTHGERRQLSVMFCDLVDSTPLAARLDPEDLSAIIRAYQRRVTTAVGRFGGYVARYVGDGALIYFGWPAAQESNAEQAVRAALAVIAAVAEAPIGMASLQVRIGIATGLVVVGEPIGDGEARQQTAIGRTPNLAARLQATAAPGCLVIDAATRRQIGNLFACVDLGPQDLKGFAETVPAWQVRTTAHRSRSAALLADRSSPPLLGRGRELAVLSQCWDTARRGNGRVALVVGEAGVGKSRLLAAIAERAGGESRQMHYFCSPQHQDSPLFPVLGDTGGAVPASVSAPAQGQGQEHLLVGFADRLAEAAARGPVLIVFEDAHWIDPTSLELLDRMVQQVRSLPVLLVVSSRPGFDARWLRLAHVTVLPLGGIHRRDALMLATRTAEPSVLPLAILEQIVRRAEGLPLFVEELTRAVVQADWHDALPDRGGAAPGLPDHTVPAALYAPLAARIDRLHIDRDVVQAAAVIGREFTLELLASVTRRPAPSLLDTLARLGEARLIHPAGATGPESYAFSHMLIRDVAYGMLLLDRRRQLHQRVAEVLRGQCVERGAAAPELLAHHYALAGLLEPAIRYWLLAGRRAFRMAAYREADRHLRKGIALLDRIADGGRRRHLAAELRSTQDLVRDAAKGYGHAFQSVFAAWRGGGRVLRLGTGGEAPDRG